MRRLYLVVEGATEERFCRRVLAPHFEELGALCFPMQVRRGGGARGGGRSWQPWRRHLHVLSRQQRGDDVRLSTMLDLYGVPRDTPGYDATLSGAALADALMAGMARQLGDRRFVPYVQVHEFEALVFAAVEHLSLIGVPGATIEALTHEATLVESPEQIDDGYETSPSRRLTRRFKSYDKVAHGADVTADCGLPTLRSRCPRFDDWVSRLEASLCG